MRLACLTHAASVHSEPGSNSSIGKLVTRHDSRECVLCLSTHHLAIPTASSRDRLTSTRTLRHLRTDAPSGHTPALLGLELFTCQRAQGPTRPQRPVIITPTSGLSITNRPSFSLFFGTPRREPRARFLEWRTTHTTTNSIPYAPAVSSTIFSFPHRTPGRRSTPQRGLIGPPAGSLEPIRPLPRAPSIYLAPREYTGGAVASR